MRRVDSICPSACPAGSCIAILKSKIHARMHCATPEAPVRCRATRNRGSVEPTTVWAIGCGVGRRARGVRLRSLRVGQHAKWLTWRERQAGSRGMSWAQAILPVILAGPGASSSVLHAGRYAVLPKTASAPSRMSPCAKRSGVAVRDSNHGESAEFLMLAWASRVQPPRSSSSVAGNGRRRFGWSRGRST